MEEQREHIDQQEIVNQIYGFTADMLYNQKKSVEETKAAPVVEEVVVDETDDLELIAVITAAIAAQEGTSTDGFVVRSIRRRPSNNWN